ncbi:hypothetical protein PHLGIDRAFT_120243 [Phlebiopsis gigantea 11061_1 CR5-6]|uniref:Uncharacterized protein n=1 Tax=Phlebiopsis gigantea (strain 11061_1 CR5-6) TaxID=745531 RepID=A0A0C3S4D1_PHLG1|nr:hypothetical protein PHLGIDRAFT_120243 [Phlebiopsis gigantea 11061_1 CR5-6]
MSHTLKGRARARLSTQVAPPALDAGVSLGNLIPGLSTEGASRSARTTPNQARMFLLVALSRPPLASVAPPGCSPMREGDPHALLVSALPTRVFSMGETPISRGPVANDPSARLADADLLLLAVTVARAGAASGAPDARRQTSNKANPHRPSPSLGRPLAVSIEQRAQPRLPPSQHPGAPVIRRGSGGGWGARQALPTRAPRNRLRPRASLVCPGRRQEGGQAGAVGCARSPVSLLDSHREANRPSGSRAADEAAAGGAGTGRCTGGGVGLLGHVCYPVCTGSAAPPGSDSTTARRARATTRARKGHRLKRAPPLGGLRGDL